MPSWSVNFNVRVDVNHPEVVSNVARAQALAAVIRDIPVPPGVRRKLDALNILRAVRGTTGIEGAELSEDEVRRIMSEPKQLVLPPNRRREELEARNAERLMYQIAEKISKDATLPLTEALVCEIHEITTQGIDYPNNEPGKYRNHPVSAGTYIPPESGEEVQLLMREFAAWFNSGVPKSWDPIVRAILAHFYVVSIHPFGDGNGRTARGIESFLLYQSGVNVRGFYSLANYYYRRREEYVQALDQVRFRSGGDLTPFLLFALRGLVTELEAVHKDIMQEVQWIAFRDFARETLTFADKLATRAGERMFHFLLGLGSEGVPLRALRRGNHPLSRLYRRVTSKTLSRDINLLRSLELITVERDVVKANLEIMKTYTPPLEFVAPPGGLPKGTKRRASRKPETDGKPSQP